MTDSTLNDSQPDSILVHRSAPSEVTPTHMSRFQFEGGLPLLDAVGSATINQTGAYTDFNISASPVKGTADRCYSGTRLVYMEGPGQRTTPGSTAPEACKWKGSLYIESRDCTIPLLDLPTNSTYARGSIIIPGLPEPTEIPVENTAEICAELSKFFRTNLDQGHTLKTQDTFYLNGKNPTVTQVEWPNCLSVKIMFRERRPDGSQGDEGVSASSDRTVEKTLPAELKLYINVADP